MPTDPGEARERNYYFALGQIGIQVALEMVLPVIGGLYLDRWLGIDPWGKLAGAALGITVGLVHLLRMLNRLEAKRPPADSQEPK